MFFVLIFLMNAPPMCNIYLITNIAMNVIITVTVIIVQFHILTWSFKAVA